MIQLQFLNNEYVDVIHTTESETVCLLELLARAKDLNETLVIEQDTELVQVASTPDILKPYYKMVSNKNYKVLLQVEVQRVHIGQVSYVLINLPSNEEEASMLEVLSYDED